MCSYSKWIMKFAAHPHVKICDQDRKKEINNYLEWPNTMNIFTYL